MVGNGLSRFCDEPIERMSVGARVEILLYEEALQGFKCGELFCFQSRDLNSILASKGFHCFIFPALPFGTCESKKMKFKLE